MIVDIGSHYGGAEKYILEFLISTSKKNNNKYYLVIKESNRLKDYATKIPNVTCVFIKENDNLFKMIRKLCKFCKKEQIDMLHAHTTASNILSSCISLILRIPLVTTVHGIINFDYSNGIKKWLYLNIEKQLLNINKQYICVSNFVKKELVNNEYNREKLSVVYNGVRVKTSQYANKKDIFRQISFKDVDLIVGTVGRLEKVKNIELFIDVVKGLVEKDIKCLGIIIGEGNERSNLLRKIKAYGLESNIILLGYTTNPYDYMELMDIYIHTSRMETFGLTVVEAAKLKKNVVCSNVGALSEIASFYPKQIHVVDRNLASEFINIIEDIYENGLDNCMELNKNYFSWEENVREIEEIYDKFI